MFDWSSKSTSSEDEIDPSLLGHILFESYLAGTYGLEGNSFSRTSAYLLRYINRLFDTYVPEKFSAVKGLYSFNRFAKRLDLIKSMNCLDDGKIMRIRDESESIAKQLCYFCQLQMKATNTGTVIKEEYLSFPGGWAAATRGHAIWYQWKITKTGLIFTLHHSGAGLQYHERLSATDRELYYPSQAYSIPFPIDQNKLGADPLERRNNANYQ